MKKEVNRLAIDLCKRTSGVLPVNRNRRPRASARTYVTTIGAWCNRTRFGEVLIRATIWFIEGVGTEGAGVGRPAARVRHKTNLPATSGTRNDGGTAIGAAAGRGDIKLSCDSGGEAKGQDPGCDDDFSDVR